jgi:pyroglutamyl-peptidase
MTPPLVFVTGFGPFEAVASNPSADVAEALAANPPTGLSVTCAVLPTSFTRSAAAFDEGLAELGRRPQLLLSLGVQSKGGTSFRLESRAARLKPGRADIDGQESETVTLHGGTLRTSLDLAHLAGELERSGAGPVTLSDDAGGYVCERIYHHALSAGEAAGMPALFLHLPPAVEVATERQIEVVRDFLPALARHAGLM